MTGAAARRITRRGIRQLGQSVTSARCPTTRTNGRPGKSGHPRWPPTANFSLQRPQGADRPGTRQQSRARQMWHAAFAALGPVDGHDLRALSDGQLLMRRDSYERETAWAPPWAGDQLRRSPVPQTTPSVTPCCQRPGPRLHASRKSTTRRSCTKRWLVPEAMAERLPRFRGAVRHDHGSPQGWEETTRQARHDALAAHSEYVRRHPDTDLPPLKSAEPQQPTEEEQAQLHAPAESYDPARLGGRHDRAHPGRQRGDSQPATAWKYPATKTTSGRDSQAWGEPAPTHRDAILQPPPPQIPPAAEVAERAADIDAEAGE